MYSGVSHIHFPPDHLKGGALMGKELLEPCCERITRKAVCFAFDFLCSGKDLCN